MRCYNCQEFGHIKRDRTNSKQERSTTSKWCSLHNSTTHNDAECKAQKGKEGANTPPQNEVTNTLQLGEVHSAHTMTVPTSTEEEDCGYAYVTSSPAPQGKADTLPRSQPVSHIHTWMTLLHFLLSALAIPVGVWGLFHQAFKGIAQMAKVGTSTDYDSSNDTNHLTMLVDSGASGHYFYQVHVTLESWAVCPHDRW